MKVDHMLGYVEFGSWNTRSGQPCVRSPNSNLMHLLFVLVALWWVVGGGELTMATYRWNGAQSVQLKSGSPEAE